MGRYKEKLLSLRQKIHDSFEDKMSERIAVPKFSPKERPFEFSEGAQALASKLYSAVQVDVHAYQPTPEPGIHFHPETIARTTAVNNVEFLKKPLVQYMSQVVMPLPEEWQNKQHKQGCFLAEVEVRSSLFPKKEKSIFDQQKKEKMGLDNQLLFRFLHAELDIARDDPEVYQSSAKIVQQLQRIASMYTQGNVANTMTAFQTLQGEHPNDKLVSFVAAHIFYHRATHGHSQFLPRARQEAKKAAASHEKINPSILLRFRYHLTAVDAYFGQNRRLDLLRSYGLLHPPSQQHADNTEFSIYLKSMILLSQTDVTLWTEKEILAVKTLAEEVIGGGFIYTAFFFDKLENVLFKNDDDVHQMFVPLLDIHIKLAAIESGLAGFEEACKEIGVSNRENKALSYRWTISQELLKKSLAVMPIPSHEDVLINISLNGEMFTPTQSLDQTIREHEMMIGPYWPVWIGKLIPEEDIYAPHNIPDQIARSETPFLHDFEDLIEALKEEEQSRIDHQKWEFTHPYQTQYSYDRIVGAGMGRTYTKLSFAPQNKVLRSHYEVWGSNMPKGLLYSEIVQQKAEEAGFANLKEISAFFEGVLKVIGDAEYGLAAKQKFAWEEYLKKQEALNNPEKQGGNDYLQRLISEIWWFFVFVIPLAIFVFMTVASSNGLPGALKAFIFIVLILGVFISVAVAIFQGSKVEKEIKHKRIHLDEQGNVIPTDNAE